VSETLRQQDAGTSITTHFGDLGLHLQRGTNWWDLFTEEKTDPGTTGYMIVTSRPGFTTAGNLLSLQYFQAKSTGPSEIVAISPHFNATESIGNELDILMMAAELGDEALFERTAKQVQWSQRPASDFVRGVHLALSAGAHLRARLLATEGARLYPDDSKIQKMARILAPPRIVRTDVSPDPSVQANHNWLRTHSEEHQGEWVALRNGSLLATAATAEELRSTLDSTDRVLITRIF
jgi:hypothetical protein